MIITLKPHSQKSRSLNLANGFSLTQIKIINLPITNIEKLD